MKKASPYRTILLTMLISSAIIIIVAFYSLTIIDKTSMKKILDIRAEKICSRIYDEEKKSSELEKQIYNEYIDRMRTITIMMSSVDIKQNHLLLEEMRAALGADELSLSDANGSITETTASYIENASIVDSFRKNIADKNFSGTYFDDGKLFVAVSRNDTDGIMQAVFTNIANPPGTVQISGIAGDYPLLKRGCTAIIDIEAQTYISHSQSGLIGKSAQSFDEKISEASGYFSERINLRASLVHYRIYNDEYLIIASVPKSEVYSRRNAVTGWMIFVCAALCFVSFLAVRKNNIDLR